MNPKAVLISRLKRWGPRWLVQRLWDQEFARGDWDRLQDTRTDSIYGYIERYAKGGSILDLGCGMGQTGVELKESAYSTLTGIDISNIAIRQAKWKANQQNRIEKNEYIPGDITSDPSDRSWFILPNEFNIILFRESLYYIPFLKIASVLQRYQQSLTPSGVFIVRMHDRVKYRHITALIQSHFTMIEQSDESVDNVTLVFR